MPNPIPKSMEFLGIKITRRCFNALHNENIRTLNDLRAMLKRSDRGSRYVLRINNVGDATAAEMDALLAELLARRPPPRARRVDPHTVSETSNSVTP